jgi:hypothetical protein
LRAASEVAAAYLSLSGIRESAVGVASTRVIPTKERDVARMTWAGWVL